MTSLQIGLCVVLALALWVYWRRVHAAEVAAAAHAQAIGNANMMVGIAGKIIELI